MNRKIFDSQNPVIAQACENCGDISWNEICQECCDHEHDPDEGFMCLNCGHEGAEDVMASAYDRWKDGRYED